MSARLNTFEGERTRLAREQAELVASYLTGTEQPDMEFVRSHVLVLLQLADGFDDDGFIRRS